MGSSLKEIKSFLDVTCYHEEEQGQGDIHSGLYPFVTISREHGPAAASSPALSSKSWTVTLRVSFRAGVFSTAKCARE